jgi:hypothetical protein
VQAENPEEIRSTWTQFKNAKQLQDILQHFHTLRSVHALPDKQSYPAPEADCFMQCVYHSKLCVPEEHWDDPAKVKSLSKHDVRPFANYEAPCKYNQSDTCCMSFRATDLASRSSLHIRPISTLGLPELPVSAGSYWCGLHHQTLVENH